MDHYRLLGVSRKAGKDEIKKAYHKLALKYHPDKNKAPDAEDKFRSLDEAYKVLLDDRKRDAYDRFDLPFAEAAREKSRSQHHSSRHHGQRRDERFFHGSSDTVSKEQKYQEELARIRFVNSELLDEANLRNVKKKARTTSAGDSSTRCTSGNIFVGEIMPDIDDDCYEKIVLDRLRSLA